MAADALNEMWDAVDKQQPADEFEHVKVPRHFWLPFIGQTRGCGTLRAEGSGTLSYALIFGRSLSDALTSRRPLFTFVFILCRLLIIASKAVESIPLTMSSSNSAW